MIMLFISYSRYVGNSVSGFLDAIDMGRIIINDIGHSIMSDDTESHPQGISHHGQAFGVGLQPELHLLLLPEKEGSLSRQQFSHVG